MVWGLNFVVLGFLSFEFFHRGVVFFLLGFELVGVRIFLGRRWLLGRRNGRRCDAGIIDGERAALLAKLSQDSLRGFNGTMSKARGGRDDEETFWCTRLRGGVAGKTKSWQ